MLFRFPPDNFPPPAHLANFVVKWPSPPAPVNPTLEIRYWFPSFSPHHYRFVSSLLRSPRSSILGRLTPRPVIPTVTVILLDDESTTSSRRAFLAAILRSSHSCAPAIAWEHSCPTTGGFVARGGPQTQRVCLR